MKQSRYVVFAFLAGVLLCAGARPACAETTWHVDDDAPADFATIQAAIDASYDGHTIIVRDGTYTGAGNRDIYLLLNAELALQAPKFPIHRRNGSIAADSGGVV